MKSKNFFLFLLSAAVFLAVITLVFSFQKEEKPGCQCDNLDQTTGAFSLEDTQAFFEGTEVVPPTAMRWLSPEEIKVLGESVGEEKWIEIDLSEQKLRAWEGNQLFLESLVSTGKWARTPTGEFRIWGKFKYAKMSGGNKALHTYYYLPNVPYIMYYQNGFGLHGTYWHNNFGHPMSHGCVNMRTVDAQKLFSWTGINEKITIYGKTPE